LSHIISRDGVSPDSEKIRAMVAWPTPINVKQLYEFLSLTGCYRKFVQQYAFIVVPLTNLLKKDSFTWFKEAQQSFD